MPDQLAQAREELALANRIIANEGVIDAFGHVSMRHPTDPGRYLLSRSRSPELVEPDDILEFTLDSQPVVPTDIRLYGERVIHGSIYQARPDVHAVCHHHSPAILPYCISGVALRPVFHLGGTIGAKAPFWDSRDDFGDTSLIVAKPEEGASLAHALGPHFLVLMRRHGAAVAGTSLQELVFRTIYTARNADLQSRAQALGEVHPLTDTEAELAGTYNLRPGPIGRAWEYWTARLRKAGGFPPPARRSAKARKTTAKRARPAKRASVAKAATRKRKAR